MLRRLSVARRLPCASAVHLHRHCFPKRLYCFSATTQRRAPQRANDDDFFVDIDSLAAFGAAAETTQQNTHTATSAAAAAAQANSQEVLGVVREVPEDEDARYSRLHIPLPPRGGDGAEESSSSKAQLRSNTRAGLRFGEEARYADSADGPATTAAEALDDDEGAAHTDSSAVAESQTEAEEGRLPDPAQLPYDDQRFAEMVLEMEVNGVIDETWQDAKKAHVEDVKEIADILTALKVRDICCIDVSEKTSNFDYVMFGTCEGARHIHLAAWAAQDADKVHRISKVKRKQTDELWEVVPIGRIVLNLMVESFREEMTLERKWAVTRAMDPLAVANAPISEGRQVKAHGLWTLTLNLQDLEDFEVDYCKDILIRQM